MQTQYTIQGNKRKSNARSRPSRRTTTRRPRPRHDYSTESIENQECGVPEYNRGRSGAQFVIGGQEPQRGQFPWLIFEDFFG